MSETQWEESVHMEWFKSESDRSVGQDERTRSLSTRSSMDGGFRPVDFLKIFGNRISAIVNSEMGLWAAVLCPSSLSELHNTVMCRVRHSTRFLHSSAQSLSSSGVSGNLQGNVDNSKPNPQKTKLGTDVLAIRYAAPLKHSNGSIRIKVAKVLTGIPATFVSRLRILLDIFAGADAPLAKILNIAVPSMRPLCGS